MDKFIAHILVVDDDDGIRSLVKKFLNENNFLVTTAENAENALEKIKIIKFDLIILDIMMPGKSGLEFLKDNKKILETPVILLTAKGEASERVEGLEIGADDYLPKPFEPKELILRIQNILNKTIKTDQKRVIKFENVEIDLNKLLIIKELIDVGFEFVNFSDLHYHPEDDLSLEVGTPGVRGNTDRFTLKFRKP